LLYGPCGLLPIEEPGSSQEMARVRGTVLTWATPGVPWSQTLLNPSHVRLSSCDNLLHGFKAARRAARAAASAPWPSLPLALPLRPGQRRSAGAKRRDAGRSTYSEFTCAGSSLLPLPGLSGAGQNPSRPSVTAGQPHPSSCLVNVHAKTTLSGTCSDQEMAAIRSRDTNVLVLDA